MTQRPSVIADVIDGAVAGALATWVMGKATSALYARENTVAREREDEARNGKTAYAVAAEQAAQLNDRELTEQEAARYGKAIHWALGVGAGAAYGVMRSRTDGAARAGGLLFGTVFWLLVDEMLTPALGLTPGPRQFPWQTHARGLAGHLVFGTVANGTLAALQGR